MRALGVKLVAPKKHPTTKKIEPVVAKPEKKEETSKIEKIPVQWNWKYLTIGVALVGLIFVLAFGLLPLVSQPEKTPEPTKVPAKETEKQPTSTVAPTLTSKPSSTPVDTSTPEVTTTPELGIGSSWNRPLDGMAMMYVPEGEFIMGTENGQADESPEHLVYLDSFWIDKTEVTYNMFARFLTENGNQKQGDEVWWGYAGWVYGQIEKGYYDPPMFEQSGEWKIRDGFEDRPVQDVSWFGAKAYCDWVRGRLPTEAEWEKSRGERTEELFHGGKNWTVVKQVTVHVSRVQ